MANAPGLYVVDKGGAGRLVVLVHGSMDRCTSFFKAAAELGDLHVITYDRRGYGRSLDVTPPARSLDDHVDDLLSVLDGRRGAVIGHSYGGVAALVASLRRPDLVRAVGTFEAPTPWMPWWPDGTAGSVVQMVDSGHSAADAAEAFLRRMLGDERWEALPRRTRDDRRAEGPALVAELAALRTGPPPYDPKKIAVPLVVGSGSKSKPHQQRSSTWLAESVDGAELFTIEGGTHGAHAGHPLAFADLIRRVVDRSDL